MILLWFILGIALAFGIARYNESNKLFWTLLFAYVMGFAGTKMVLQATDGNEQSDVKTVQMYPTQMPSIAEGLTVPFQTAISMVPVKVTALESVVQELPSDLHDVNITLSKVSERTRDQPILTLIKPPELCLQKDFLTLHDTG